MKRNEQDMPYAWEKFNLAIHTLKGSGSPKDRLVGAFDTIMVLRPEEVPDEKQSDFTRLFEEMTSMRPEADEDPVQTTVNHANDVEVERVMERIASMNAAIKRHRLLA